MPKSDGLAFITGASSGIGQAMAIALHHKGFRLALVGRRVPDMEDWANQVGLQKGRYRIYHADVSEVASIVEAGLACIEHQGVPDVVVASAGISVGMDSSIKDDLKVMAQTFAINNTGMAATFHPFLAGMKQRGSGTLVGIASVAAMRGLPGHGAYCASKAAVINYCESLRVELRGTGVKVVTLLPGYIDTPMTRQNRYAMPFMLKAEAFATRAVDVIEKERSYCVIPWQMGIAAMLLRIMPDGLYDRLLKGRPRKRRQGEG